MAALYLINRLNTTFRQLEKSLKSPRAVAGRLESRSVAISCAALEYNDIAALQQ